MAPHGLGVALGVLVVAVGQGVSDTSDRRRRSPASSARTASCSSVTDQLPREGAQAVAQPGQAALDEVTGAHGRSVRPRAPVATGTPCQDAPRAPRARLPAAALLLVALAGCGGGRSSSAGGCGDAVRERLDPTWTVHLVAGAEEPEFLSDPPTSGPHFATEPPTGAQEEPLDRPLQVSMLEAGQVLLQYDPAEVEAAEAEDAGRRHGDRRPQPRPRRAGGAHRVDLEPALRIARRRRGARPSPRSTPARPRRRHLRSAR